MIESYKQIVLQLTSICEESEEKQAALSQRTLVLNRQVENLKIELELQKEVFAKQTEQLLQKADDEQIQLEDENLKLKDQIGSLTIDLNETKAIAKEYLEQLQKATSVAPCGCQQELNDLRAENKTYRRRLNMIDSTKRVSLFEVQEFEEDSVKSIEINSFREIENQTSAIELQRSIYDKRSSMLSQMLMVKEIEVNKMREEISSLKSVLEEVEGKHKLSEQLLAKSRHQLRTFETLLSERDSLINSKSLALEALNKKISQANSPIDWDAIIESFWPIAAFAMVSVSNWKNMTFLLLFMFVSIMLEFNFSFKM